MKSDKRLVLYSGGQERSNRWLHQGLLDLVGLKKRIRMTYVPFCSDGSGIYFNRFQRRYGSYGATEFHMLAPDQEFSERSLKKALNGDVIYLAGGNTFYFLKHLRKSGLLKELREYVKQGGVLAGLSAGAIIMTPNIEMAHFPPYEIDDNGVGLKNLKGLGLVNFEFFPHFVNSKRMNESMLMYSLISKYPIFACADGSGIVINGEQKSLIGHVSVFFKGKKLRIDKWG